MVGVGAMRSRKQPTDWKRDTFQIHRSKLRLYQRRTLHRLEEKPYRDPADLAPFDASDRKQVQIEMTDCFSDVGTVRCEHVEPRRGDQTTPWEVQQAFAPPSRGEINRGDPITPRETPQIFAPPERERFSPKPPLIRSRTPSPLGPSPPRKVTPHKGEELPPRLGQRGAGGTPPH